MNTVRIACHGQIIELAHGDIDHLVQALRDAQQHGQASTRITGGRLEIQARTSGRTQAYTHRTQHTLTDC